MKQIVVHNTQPGRSTKSLTAQRMMAGMWLFMGLAPLLLQVRSYSTFVTPHKIDQKLVVPSSHNKLLDNITEHCPVQGYLLASVWWNSEPIHYYNTENGILCHLVLPQYNIHGNYLIGTSRVEPYESTPTSCTNDSYSYHQYFYHGSIGYYSYFEEHHGTFCSKDKVAYIHTTSIGSFDINGSFLAADPGSIEYRRSYWYGIVGAIWLVYRIGVLRRSCVLCLRYGRRCDEMGENLLQKEAMVFVQESLRLSAHGASNYQRLALLYLIIEGIMTDLFLIIASEGLTIKIQYASLGYNLSGLMLLVFEIAEHTRFVSDRKRQLVMRLLFSYETSLLGEFVTAIVLQYFLSALHHSDLKKSEPVAHAVSYYFWSLVCHALVVIVTLLIIVSVRSLCAITYVWTNYRSLAIFTQPCCVDTAFGARGRIAMLSGYRLRNGQLYFTLGALKAFGLLKMKDSDREYLVLRKLHWFGVPEDTFVGIGIITGDRVDPCNEQPCTGLFTFPDRMLGGASLSCSSPPRPLPSTLRTVAAGPTFLDEVA